MTPAGLILLLLITASLGGLDLYLALRLLLTKRRSRRATAAKRQSRGSKEG